MQVRIVTKDGRTEVTNLETGEIVEDVFNVEFSHNARGRPEAHLMIYATEVDIECTAKAIDQCILCGRNSDMEANPNPDQLLAVESVSDSHVKFIQKPEGFKNAESEQD
jgi:hypothetical protein